MNRLFACIVFSALASPSFAAPTYRFSVPLSIGVPYAQPGDSASGSGPNESDSNQGDSNDDSNWVAGTPIYSEWNAGTIYKCQNLSPLPSAYQGAEQVEGDHDFQQVGTNCSLDYERTRQDWLYNSSTQEHKNNGDPVAETKTETGVNGVRMYGQKLFSWWSTNGENALYDCQTHTPEASTVRAGEEFQQSVTNCTESMSRGGMGYYYDNKVGWIEDSANPYQTYTTLVYGVNRTIRAWGTKEWSELDAQ